MTRFFVGLDLGQAQDYTAISVLEKIKKTEEQTVEEMVEVSNPYALWESRWETRQVTREISQPAHYQCRHLKRFPLGTRYPAIVEQVKTMLATPELRGDNTLVVDATGAGRPVVDMFTQAGLSPVAVTITGGHAVTYDKGMNYVPKRVLVSILQVLAQSERIKTAPIEYREVLNNEMLNFQLTVTEAANDTYAGRSGTHDDLVLAVALAAWKAENVREMKFTF